MIKSMNVASWVRRWGELNPAKPAVLFEDQAITYQALHGRAVKTGQWLKELGLRKGHRLAALLDNCPEFIQLYLACARLGAIFVPLNFRLAPPEVDYILGHCQPSVVVFGRGFQSTLSRTNAWARFKPAASPLPDCLVLVGPRTGEAAGLEAEASDPEEPHVIMYTSGTTGNPKGAVLSHRKTFFNCLNADIFFNLSSDDVMLIILPLFHSGGLFIMASPTLYKGATILLHRRFDPVRAFQDIQRYKVTKFLGVPTVYRAMLKLPPERRADVSSLKVCAIGGEKVTPELLAACQEAGFSTRQIMGQTETSILLWASEEESIKRPGTVGRPVFHADVRLVDKQGREVEPGQVGEIVARGSILLTAYWRGEAQTEETMRHGWLHTGDLARVDEDGYFYLVDRVRDMYISGGENVYPAEIERVLKTHPDIEDAAVIGVLDETWGEVGHAFIIPRRGAGLSVEEIISFSQDRLARYKCPHKVTFVRDFPRTALGKVRKFLLAQKEK